MSVLGLYAKLCYFPSIFRFVLNIRTQERCCLLIHLLWSFFISVNRKLNEKDVIWLQTQTLSINSWPASVSHRQPWDMRYWDAERLPIVSLNRDCAPLLCSRLWSSVCQYSNKATLELCLTRGLLNIGCTECVCMHKFKCVQVIFFLLDKSESNGGRDCFMDRVYTQVWPSAPIECMYAGARPSLCCHPPRCFSH